MWTIRAGGVAVGFGCFIMEKLSRIISYYTLLQKSRPLWRLVFSTFCPWKPLHRESAGSILNTVSRFKLHQTQSVGVHQTSSGAPWNVFFKFKPAMTPQTTASCFWKRKEKLCWVIRTMFEGILKNTILFFNKESQEWVPERRRDRVSSGLQFAHNIGMWIHEARTVSRKITCCNYFHAYWPDQKTMISRALKRAAGQLTVMSATPNNYQFNVTFTEAFSLQATHRGLLLERSQVGLLTFN